MDWGGKKKAVTFSFDDGVTQDRRLVELLNRYQLKATFNLNSACFGKTGKTTWLKQVVPHDKIQAQEVATLYKGHEVAAHTRTHPNLTKLDEETIVEQVERDREELSALCGYEVLGMAYPCGGVNNDERVAEIIGRRPAIQYARTISCTNNFDLQSNYLRFNPSVYYTDGNFEKVVDDFLALQTDKPQLLYIWGHSYEMDAELITWETFERICKKLSGKADIFYGTNREVLL